WWPVEEGEPMSYDVQIEALRDSARAARSAAGQVGKVEPGEALTGGASSMPGARSVGAMQRVSRGWTTELTSWATAARAYGTTLDTNAAQYELDDDAAGAAFGPVGKD